jgi:hypothetical protein
MGKIPLDIKVAAAGIAIVLLFMIFEFGGGLFAAIYIAVCAYVAVQAFSGKGE